MTKSKERAPGIRTTRESEIFREPPGSGNYSSSIGAAQGIERSVVAVECGARAPPKLFLSRRAKFRSSLKLTCWWSVAARPERPPP